MDREFILEKIREYAYENGGVTPGKRAIQNFAGIKESDWSGKYWARWNEAITDAGLSPNELNTKLDFEHVINHYIALIRELGRIPVHSELKLRARQDQNFPSANSFHKHLGKLSTRAAGVKIYCQKKTGLDDVIAICDAAIASGRKRNPTSSNRIEEQTSATINGFVYLMKSGKYYKIGKTNSVDRRQYEIGLQLPEGIKPIHSIETDDPSGIEAYWHNRFKDKRLNGEWFNLTASDVRIFRKRKFM